MWFIPNSETQLINKLVHLKWLESNKEAVSIKKKVYNDAHIKQNRDQKRTYIMHNIERVKLWEANRRIKHKEKRNAYFKNRYESKISEGYRYRKDPETGKHHWVFVGKGEV